MENKNTRLMGKEELFQIVNKATIEMLEDTSFWERFNAIRCKLQEFEVSMNTGFEQASIRIYKYRGRAVTRCVDLFNEAENFERYVKAFYAISRDIVSDDPIIDASKRDECLVYAYVRLKFSIEEIERLMERTRIVCARQPTQKMINAQKRS